MTSFRGIGVKEAESFTPRGSSKKKVQMMENIFKEGLLFQSKNKSSGEVPFFLSPHNEAVDVKQLQPLKVLLLLKESQLCSSFSPLVSSASFHPSVVFLNLMSFSLATVFFFFVCFFAR